MRDNVMQAYPGVSVIICAYTEKRLDALLAAVRSVQQQTLPAEEIIVVIDRNPTLLRRVQEHLEGVIVTENQEAKGASGARNSGVAISHGEILAFLDDDAIANPDWLERVVSCYADPNIVGVGGKIDPLWLKARPSWFPEEFHWVVGCSYRGLPTQNAVVRNVIGANMSVRRVALERVGGFRASFGNNKGDTQSQSTAKWLHHQAGDEETELCIRISQQLPGSAWLYAVSAAVRHQVPAQRTHRSYFLWRCYDEGLGKAMLARLHDSRTSLSSERDYTFKVLPDGVLRGLGDTLRGDATGLLRAGAIISGLIVTVAGYLVGSIVARKPHAESESSPVSSELLDSHHPSLVQLESSSL